MSIKGSEIIEKRNVLNDIRRNNMTVQELRLFSIYLSKISSRDISTRVVRFPLSEFQKIMDFGRLNIARIQETVDSLLSKVARVPNEDGGFTSFQLFKECTVSKSEDGQWYMEIDSHDRALPLMFDFKTNYFTYELWNTLKLKSVNQIRMYEILKQYEYLGKREIEIAELRELLGINPEDYPRFHDFKVRVLDNCQKALAESTDITYTYKKGKTGSGGKWLTIIFTIKKNPKFVDKLKLNKFINDSIIKTTAEEPKVDASVAQEPETTLPPELLKELSEACQNEFSEKELGELYTLISAFVDEQKRIFYFKTKISELNYRASKKPIRNRYGYIRKLIDNDYHDDLHQNNRKQEKPDSYGATYDINEYESHSVVDEEEYKPKESYRAAYDIAEFEREKGDEEEW